MTPAGRHLGLISILSVSIAVISIQGRAADLATAPPESLMQIYAQIRQLKAGDQWAAADGKSLKRDAGTFNFTSGRLNFAAPVEGHVVAASFEGQGAFELNPPTPIDQRQIARFTKGAPKLEDSFRKAVFFFTDDSFAELQKLVKVQSGGAPPAADTFVSVQKKFSENFNDWWSNESKGNPQMRNLSARMLADLTDPTSRGFFLADFKGDKSGDLIFLVSWNRDSIILPAASNDEEVVLIHYNRGNYFEWWSGFHVAEEYTKSPRPEHRTLLAHCRRQSIEANIPMDRDVTGATEMEFEVPAAPVRVLPLSLRGVLRISSVQDADGKPLSFIQEERDLDSDPWVILSEPAKPGQVYKMKIAYAEKATRDSRIIFQRGSGLYYVTQRESWFPSFGAFDDRTNYTVRFRSPKKFKFVGTGRLVKSEKLKDALETQWESEIPYSVVGFNYGEFVEKSLSEPNFTVTAYAGKAVPDELKAVQSAIDMEELAGGVGGSKNIAGEMGIATGGFNTAANVGYAAAVSMNAMKLFQYYFGGLPFKSVAVTEQPVRGYGQSWPTLIFLPYDSLLDSTTRNSLHLQESAEEREFFNIVAIHEMAHQWWGHLVGWKTYHDAWLSEGFAEFSAGLYLSKTDPKKFRNFWDLKRRWLLSSNQNGHRPVDVGPLWLSLQLPAYNEESLYQILIYSKGSYVLEMLRAMMEDTRAKEPDARFINMMRDFASTYAGKNASTEDFRRVVEKHTGEPMDWFFNQWVYGTEVPTFDFNYELKDAGGGKTQLKMTLAQSGVSSTFQSRVPIFFYQDGQPRRLGIVKVVGAKPATGDTVLPFRPEKITLDEFHSMLCYTR